MRQIFKACFWPHMSSFWLLGSIITFVVSPAMMLAQTCDIGTNVGFQGLKIEANGPFTITFNGLSIEGAYHTDETNKLWTKLVPGKTYDMTSEGTYWVHVKFDVPNGKRIFVDDIETTEILSSNSVNTWKIRLEADCDCGDEKAGSSSGPKLGSVLWQVGLGQLSDGRSARSLSLREEVLTAAIYKPSALIYSSPLSTDEIDVVLNPDGTFRQVKANEALADIIVLSSSEYDIKFYDSSNIGAKDGSTGIYALTGQPFVVWKIKNPTPPNNDRLQISRIQNGVTETSEYLWDSGTGAWSLSTSASTRIESKTISIDPVSGDRTETTTVKDNLNVVSSKFSTTFHAFPWGEEIIREVQDPDSANLITSYTYYEDENEDGKYAHQKTIIYPDGSWEKYDYDFIGNRTKIIRPWKDQDLATATESNSRVTLYTNRYIRTQHLGEMHLYNYIYEIEEQVEGVTVQKRRFYRSPNTIDDLFYGVTETETVFSSSQGGQTTVTTRYDQSQSDEWMWLAGRISSVVHPDGRLDTYSYEKGSFVANPDPSLSQFTPDINGESERQTVVRSTAANPDNLSNKTTKDTTIVDRFGRTVFQESHVYGGSNFERVGWTAQFYDALGHLTETRSHNGTIVSAIWTGSDKTSATNQEGIETVYTYDAQKRVKTSTKKGISASGGFAAQPDIVTTYSYDADGRVTGQVTTAGGLSLSETTVFDLAGRIQSKTDEAGLVTTYSYSNGGRTTTVVLPGGATQITENYLDGQTKRRSGTAVASTFYEYGINTADGTKLATKFIGSTDSSSPRWEKTTTDWAGHTIKIEKPGFTGQSLVQTYLYNLKGQLTAAQAFSGGTKLVADRLYEYNNWGEHIRSGHDIDGSGALTLSSTDRVTEEDSFYEKNGNDWFRVKTSKTYLTNNSAAATTTLTAKERLNNFSVNGTEQTISEEITVDVAGNQSTTSSIVDRAAKKSITRTDVPGSNLDSVRTAVNGLLQLSNTNSPQADTVYSYDGLGRNTSISDPVSGSMTKSYDAATGRLISGSHGPNTTSFEYYPSTHASAGKVKAITNPNNKKQYYNYNPLGEVLQTWGDTIYPVEYIYDSYGQKTEMHTFREGSGWSSLTWPTGTTGSPDVIKWIYHDGTGLLQQKRDATNGGPTYAYDALGRLTTRTWVRTTGSGSAISTSYSRDSRTGELTAINYSDATPDVTFASDRGGRVINVNDASGGSAFTYNPAGQQLSHQIATGPLDGVTVSTGYDALLRRTSLTAVRNAASLVGQTFGYDPTSRLQTVVNGTNTATYAYHPSSGLLNSVSFSGGTSFSRTYDTLGRLQSVTNSPAAGGASGFVYTYNNLDQRTRATQQDNSYWSYTYNDRGEIISGKKYWDDDTHVAGQQAEYFYDNIGNRALSKSGGDSTGQNLRTSTYSPNSLNQYSQRTVPGEIDVIGTANAGATVTVNNMPVYRRADYFQKTLIADNSTNPVYTQVTAVGAKNATGTNAEDSVSQQSGFVYLPRANEALTYDPDGNLINDGRWQYTWDAENRLQSMTALPSTPIDAKKRLEYSYDFQGRRIQKKVYGWNVGSSSYQLRSTSKFVYDGWNVIAELDGSNLLLRAFVWGRDLLLINEAGNTYQVGFDGNENVSTLVTSSTGTSAASYDYDPFGNLLKSTGEYSTKNPIRFSSKYIDAETNLIYYGYRYYNPQLGNWISRDPSEETGGVNLYGFVKNDPINSIDHLGLWVRNDDWRGGWGDYAGSVVAERCDTYGGLAQQITGYASDRVMLSNGGAGKVEIGQTVQIGPLLNKLESRIRDNAVQATNSFRSGPTQVPTGPHSQASINQYFRPNQLPADCQFAGVALLAKGLMGVLKSGEFDRLGYNWSLVGHGLHWASKPRGHITQLFHGDLAYIKNYPDYMQRVGGVWQGEWVIALPNGRGFWGQGIQGSYRNIRDHLMDEFITGSGRPSSFVWPSSDDGAAQTGQTPGFTGKGYFLNVPHIAANVFDLRGAR